MFIGVIYTSNATISCFELLFSYVTSKVDDYRIIIPCLPTSSTLYNFRGGIGADLVVGFVDGVTLSPIGGVDDGYEGLRRKRR